jgi:hypothetical protein
MAKTRGVLICVFAHAVLFLCFGRFTARAATTMYVHLENNLTIPVGESFAFSGSVYSDVAITNVHVTVGGRKLAEQTFNEKDFIFGFTITNDVPGQQELWVKAVSVLGPNQ